MIKPVTIDKGRFRKFGREYPEGIHLGHDFDCPEGTPVFSVCRGVVAFSGDLNGFGSLNPSTPGGVVVIRHDDDGSSFWGLYGHVSSTVKTSDIVNEGDIIGRVSGFSNAGNYLPHLHFGKNVGIDMPLCHLGYNRELGEWVNPLK